MKPAPGERLNRRDVPHDEEAERSVLSSLLLGKEPPNALGPAAFYSPRHQTIFAALMAVVGSGGVADVVSVAHRLRSDGLLGEVGGVEALHELQNLTPSVSAFSQHVDIIKQLGRQRRLVLKSDDLGRAANAGDEARIATLLDELTTLATPAPGVGPAVAPVDWVELFGRPRETEDWLVPRLWPRGRMISLSAPVKARKSLLMLYLSACLAAGRDPWTDRARTPIRVVYLDFEMTEDDLIERLEDMEFGPETLGNLRYFLRPDLPHLDTPEGGRLLLGLLDDHDPAALVIDTFSRVVSTVDWGGHEVREFYRWSAMHVKARGISVARLDHVGHTVTNRAAGSHHKGADVDVGWVIQAGDDDALKVEHHGLTRVRWVPAVVDLVMTEDPLAFRQAAGTIWLPGTSDLADELDLLGLPVEVTVKVAQEALQAADKGRNRTLIRDAVRFRKERE